MKLPGVCTVCRAPVEWSAKMWREPGQRGRGRHVCSESRPYCNALMIYQQRCARRPGHTTEHRTAYSIANARAARIGRRAA